MKNPTWTPCLSLPTQSIENALQVCDGTTEHFVQSVAYCDTPERAAAIIDRLKLADQLKKEKMVLVKALKAIDLMLAAYRDAYDKFPIGAMEELKYELVDRAIDLVEPGFDGDYVERTTEEMVLKNAEKYLKIANEAGGYEK